MSRITFLFIGILIGFLSEYFYLRHDEKNTYLIGCGDGMIEATRAIVTRDIPRFCNTMFNESTWRVK